MNAAAFAAVGAGAMLGAWARWGLGAWLNPLVTNLPLGRLVANLAAALHSALHLFGAILATVLGFATYRALA